jgi:hypothetical protein
MFQAEIEEKLNMKNCLKLILGVLFVLLFSEGAFAVHAEIPAETQAVVAKDDVQITLGGEIRIRGWNAKNIGDDSQQDTSEKTAQDDNSQKSTPQSNKSHSGK